MFTRRIPLGAGKRGPNPTFVSTVRRSFCELYRLLLIQSLDKVGTGTLEDALDWVEYCNGTGNTYWANKRRENNGGNPEPYRVKYWGLGEWPSNIYQPEPQKNSLNTFYR